MRSRRGRRRSRYVRAIGDGRWFVWLLFVLAGVVAANSLHLVGADDPSPPTGVLGEVITRDTVAPSVPASAPEPVPSTVAPTTTIATPPTTATPPTVAAVPTARPKATAPRATAPITAPTTTSTDPVDTTSTWPPYNPTETAVPPQT